MNIWIMIGFHLGAVLALAQNPDRQASAEGPACLAFPRNGVPLSMEQIEERETRSGDGTLKNEILRSRVFRDSAGRVRIEPEPSAMTSGQMSGSPAVLVDPPSKSTVALIEEAKTAYRMPLAGEGISRATRLMIDGELSPSIKWKSTKEDAGVRAIEGLMFRGTRIIQVAEGKPELKYTIETWYSDVLKITGLEIASGPNGTRTARIQNLRQEEPDPKLFTIPSDYRVIDVDPK